MSSSPRGDGPAACPPAPGWKLAAGLATVYVVWGSTYLAIRLMVETVPALIGAGVRFGLAGLLMYAWVRLRRPEARATPRELGAAAVVGVLLVLGGNGLVTVAEDRHLPSGIAALLIASEPLWVILFRRLSRERLPKGTFAGVAVGFAGVGLLLAPGQRPAGVEFLGYALCLLAAASWAGGSFISSRVRMPSDPLHSTALQMVFGGGTMLALGFAVGEGPDVHLGAISTRSALALAYLLIFGSLLAFTAYAWLLRNAPISTVSTYAYVNPLIAVLLGWAFVSEPVGASTLIGMTVIVASVAFIVRREGVSSGGAPPAPEAATIPAQGPPDRDAKARVSA